MSKKCLEIRNLRPKGRGEKKENKVKMPRGRRGGAAAEGRQTLWTVNKAGISTRLGLMTT